MSLKKRRKVKNIAAFAYAFLLLGSSLGHATSAKSKLLLGDGGYDETLTGEGTFIEGSRLKKTDTWFWSGDFEFSELPTTTTVGTNILEHTYVFMPETGYEPGNGFGVQTNYNYSYTPEEALVSSGPELDFYYTFENTEKTEKKDAFRPSLKFRVGGKDIEYVQTFNGSTAPGKNGATRPTTGFNNLRQIGVLEEVSAFPWDFLSIGCTFTYYFYDRDVATFLNYLNAPSSARLGVGGFSSSVTNFAQSTLDFLSTIYLSEKWNIELELINSVSAVDTSLGWSYQGVLNREFGDLTVGLGAERDTSPLIGDNYYSVFTLEYEF